MPRANHKYHYIYKTTCSVTGRYYIGMHSTSNLDDSYLGSGQRLWKSIKKHGKDKHSKEILEFLEDRSSLKKRESELVNETLLNDRMCMNIALGGEGGFIVNNAELRKVMAKAGNTALNSKLQNDSSFAETFSYNISKGLKNRISKNGAFWQNKNHTKETKSLMSEKAKQRCIIKPIHTTGKLWIHSLSEKRSLMIQPNDFDKYEALGWIKGRKLKF